MDTNAAVEAMRAGETTAEGVAAATGATVAEAAEALRKLEAEGRAVVTGWQGGQAAYELFE